MGVDPFTIGMMLMSVASAAMTASSASEQAQAQADIASQNAQLQVNELARQQQDVNTKAAEEKSDRIKAAEKELASARVASAEGFSMGTRLAGEIGYNEGLDLSRIESSRLNNTDAITSRMKAAATGTENATAIATAQSKAASQGAFMGLIGSGMSIMSGGYDRAVKTATANHTTTPTVKDWLTG